MVVAVVGAGLAGLTAAVSLVEAGVDVVVLERDDEPGGTSLLSSGQAWRYRMPADAAWGAPGADQQLLDVVSRGLGQALSWLATRTGAVTGAGATSQHTESVRIDMPRCIDGLAGALPEGALRTGVVVSGATRSAGGNLVLLLEAGGQLDVDAIVFAGGGAAGDLERVAREAGIDGGTAASGRHWFSRSAGTSDGSSIDAALQVGGRATPPGEACYARLVAEVPRLGRDDWISQAQVYGAHATLVDESGRVVERAPHDWSDSLLAWTLALRGGRGWLLVPPAALEESTPYGTVRECIDRARARGAGIVECRQATIDVPVRVGITHSLGGLAVDSRARVRTTNDADPDLFAAGVDVGGMAGRGYVSGLAQALVLGRVAAASAASCARA